MLDNIIKLIVEKRVSMEEKPSSFYLLSLGDTTKPGSAQCTVLGWWGNDNKMHIVIVDCGSGYLEEDLRVIPDIDAISSFDVVIEAILITHIHADHEGAVFKALELLRAKSILKLSPRVQLVGSPATIAYLKSKFGLFSAVAPFFLGGRLVELTPYKPTEICRTGEPIQVTAYPVVHSTVGAIGIYIAHPKQDWSVFFTGDFSQIYNLPSKCTALLFDATSADKPGFSQTQSDALNRLQDLYHQAAEGRVIFVVSPRDFGKVELALEAGQKAGRANYCFVGDTLQENASILKDHFCDFGLKRVTSDQSAGSPSSTIMFVQQIGGDSRFLESIHLDKSDTLVFEFPDSENEHAVLLRNTRSRVGKVITPQQGGGSNFPSHACQLDIASLIRAVRPLVAIPYQGDQTKHEAIKAFLNDQRICGSWDYNWEDRTGSLRGNCQTACTLVPGHMWLSMFLIDGLWKMSLDKNWVVGVPKILKNGRPIKYPLTAVRVTVSKTGFKVRVSIDCGQNAPDYFWQPLRTLMIALSSNAWESWSKKGSFREYLADYLRKYLPNFVEWGGSPKITVSES